MKQEGILIIISGPSGTGKSTIVKEFINRNNDVELSVSATTRKIRPGEQEGKNYFFLSKKDFTEKLKEESFLEYAEVYGNYYGTPRDFVDEKLKAGKNVLLEIDTEGALQIKDKFPQGVFIFIVPPSINELQRRINSRGTETEEEVERRLNSSLEEIKQLTHYDYVVMNDHISDAVQLIEAILKAEKVSVLRSGNYWLSTFTS